VCSKIVAPNKNLYVALGAHIMQANFIKPTKVEAFCSFDYVKHELLKKE
jgi:hypothetical protein